MSFFKTTDVEGDMANRRLSMRKIKEVLRLKYEAGLSNRAIARSCNITHRTVKSYLVKAEAAGMRWPLPGKVKLPDMAWVHRKLKRKGVTRYLLWEEFTQTTDHPCSYSGFCEFYRCWRKKADLVMRQDHKAGEKMFVDYAGVKMGVVDSHTGELRRVPVFVAVLGASSYIYAEATEKEDLKGFIGAHIRAFEYFGLLRDHEDLDEGPATYPGRLGAQPTC